MVGVTNFFFFNLKVCLSFIMKEFGLDFICFYKYVLIRVFFNKIKL